MYCLNANSLISSVFDNVSSNKLHVVFRERIARMKEEDRLEYEAMERRLRRDLITKTFPKTREDFDQLYAMVSSIVMV